nr:hypothetical protein C5F59_14710 [Streptomyces sp. QL37]
MILASLLAGCSGEPEAVPELPDRLCWDVFAAEDVAPLLPTGDKAALRTRAFVLGKNLDMPTCNVDIDDRPSFQAMAIRRSYEKWIDWKSIVGSDPDSVDVGKKGLVWGNGAAAYIVCQPSKGPAAPGSYIELRLTTFRSENDEQEVRSVLPTLLKNFAAFTQRELKCV